MKYPSETQSALLFDRPFLHIEAFANKAVAVLTGLYDAPFRISECNPGLFYRIYGGNEVMITIEYMPSRANVALFDLPLSSPITTLLCPDMPARIEAHQTHVLIGVSHGVWGNSPEIAAMLDQMNYPKSGATLAHFMQRLELCERLTQMAQECQQASAIHWTQSDQLLDHKSFTAFGGMPAPSPLHVHPYLLGSGTSETSQNMVSVIGLGSSQFVGRTVTMRASVLPWQASYEAIFVFLRVALAPNGYIIPDTDTFGNEQNSESYRVRHIDAQGGMAAFFELEPLLHREHGFQAASYVERGNASFDDRTIPSDLLPKDPSERANMTKQLQAKRAMAEGIGGKFDVRRVVGGRMVPPAEPPKSQGFFARMKRFGRK